MAALGTEAGIMFVTGVMGSLHCVGMCGGFVGAIASRPAASGGEVTGAARLLDQLSFHGGKASTYAFLGALSGAAGVVVRDAAWLGRADDWLAIASGVFLVGVGLHLLGAFGYLMRSLRRRTPPEGLVQIKPAPSQTATGILKGGFLKTLRRFMRGTGATAPFFAGLFTGFLPCGLVYAAAARAAATADALHGALGMAAFGAGTAPALLATALFGTMVGMRRRRRLVIVASLWIVVLGVVTIGHGADALMTPPAPEPHCPFCG